MLHAAALLAFSMRKCKTQNVIMCGSLTILEIDRAHMPLESRNALAGDGGRTTIFGLCGRWGLRRLTMSFGGWGGEFRMVNTNCELESSSPLPIFMLACPFTHTIPVSFSAARKSYCVANLINFEPSRVERSWNGDVQPSERFFFSAFENRNHSRRARCATESA